MSDQKPTIVSLQPLVFPDNRRVMLDLVVENLPVSPGDPHFIGLDMLDNPSRPPGRPGAETPSPYPNIELSILNSQRQELVSLFIVEHKERQTSLTLHLPALAPAEAYIARVEMTYQDKTLQVVEAPFTLNPAE